MRGGPIGRRSARDAIAHRLRDVRSAARRSATAGTARSRITRSVTCLARRPAVSAVHLAAREVCARVCAGAPVAQRRRRGQPARVQMSRRAPSPAGPTSRASTPRPDDRRTEPSAPGPTGYAALSCETRAELERLGPVVERAIRAVPPDERQDLHQETMFRLIRHAIARARRSDFSAIENWEAYAVATAHNVRMRWLRTQARVDLLDPVDFQQMEAPPQPRIAPSGRADRISSPLCTASVSRTIRSPTACCWGSSTGS